MALDFSHCPLPPFKHQMEDVQSLIDNPYFFITSEMRTGKTKIVIDAAQFLYLSGVIDKVLIIAPAPVRDVWADPTMGEIQKHAWKHLPSKVTVFHSSLKTWETKKDDDPLQWMVTNYEFVRSKMRLTQLLPFCTASTLLVLDESSFIKTWDAAQTRACLQLRRACGRVVLLNGTPISHSPMDLFSQGNLLHPSILNCKYITHFRARYAVMGGFEIRGHPTQVASWVNLDDLQKRFAPYVVRRLQKDCLDLPPKLDPVTLTAELDPATWKLYKEMRDECVLMFQQGASVAVQAVTKTIRLAQITSGFVGGIQQLEYDKPENKDRPDWIPFEGDKEGWDVTGTPSGGYTTQEVSREKLDIVLWFLKQRLIEEPNLKIVVWCRFRPELTRLLKEVESKFPQFEMGAIHGGQKKDDRLRSMQLLHPQTAPKGPVFVGGTFGTGAFGLNFTAANTSVNCSFDYSLGKFLQSADRVYGPGQISPVAYFDVVATGPQGQKTIDHIIVKARRNREDIANWVSSDWVKALKDE